MGLEFIETFLFFAIRQLANSYIVMNAFRDHLRVSVKKGLAIMCCYFLVKAIFLSMTSATLSIPLQYMDGVIFVFFLFSLFKAPIHTLIIIYLFMAHIIVMLQTFSIYMADQQLLPFSYNTTIICGNVIFYTLCFYPLYKMFNKFAEVLLKSKARKTIIFIDIILALNLIAQVITGDYKIPVDFNLVIIRAMHILPMILFVSLIIDTLQQIELNKKMSFTLDNMKMAHAAEKHYFDFVISSWQNSRKERHNMRHLALLLLEYLHKKEYDKAEKAVNTLVEHNTRLQSITISGHDAIDGIVGYWQMTSAQADIKFTQNIKIEKILVDDLDLGLTLSNALENAYTAAKYVDNKKAFIDVNITTKNGLLLIAIKNSFAGELVEVDDHLYSHKRDYKEIGTGTEYIKDIAAKYDGWSKYYAEDKVFTLNIALKNQKKEEAHEDTSL